MIKEVLRKKFILIRKEIKNKDKKSQIIMNKIINLSCFKNAKTIAIYSNLNMEVNTTCLIKYMLKEKEVYLPRVIDDNNMEFYKINSLLDISSKGNFGIKEPLINDKNKLDKEKLDLIIIPGICFDRNKNRIGFGKGYYDKYLLGINNAFKIGICFNEQVLVNDFIESNINDVKMDMVLTDKILIE